MGAKPILAKQYFAPIFFEQFDLSCAKYTRWLNGLSFKTETITKKQAQKRISISKEVQELIKHSHVLDIRWITATTARLLLSTGAVILIYVTEDDPCREITFGIEFFPELVNIQKVVWHKEIGVLMTTDGKVSMFKWDLTLRSSELVQMDPFPNFLPSSLCSKRLERNVVINSAGTILAIWWSGHGGTEVHPWNPKPEQRANVLVYKINFGSNGDRPELIFYKKTDGNLVAVEFTPGDTLVTLEEYNPADKTIITELRMTSYHLSSSSVLSKTTVPLQSQLKCQDFDSSKTKICIGLCNSSVVISSENGQNLRSRKAAFVPCHLTWHTNSFAILLTGPIGQVQMFDIALNPLFLKDQTESYTPSLTTQLEPPRPIFHASWSLEKNLVLVGFETGNFGVLDLYTGGLTLTDLVTRHLEASPIAYAQALRVLQSISWDADDCRTAFNSIFSRLRVEPYSEVTEKHFESLFETYFLPKIQSANSIWTKHRDQIVLRAEAYAHWLFLANRFKRSLEVGTMIRSEQSVAKVLLGARRHLAGDDIVAEAEAALKELRQQRRDSESSKNSCCSNCTSSPGSDDEVESETEDVTERLGQISTTVSLEQNRNEPVATTSSDACVKTPESSHITVVPLGLV